MSRLLMLIIFITVACSVYFGMHWVVFKFLVKNIPFSARGKLVLILFFAFSGLSFVFTMPLKTVLNLGFLVHYSFIWLGIMSIGFTVISIAWLVQKIFNPPSLIFTSIVLGIILALSVISLINGFAAPELNKIKIPLKNLPSRLSGFTLVHLSDLHLESYKSKKELKDLIGRINALTPDLVVITGDLMDGNLCEDEEICSYLKSLKTRYGTLAVTGNHEFYGGIEHFERMTQKTGMRWLRNQMVVIGEALQVVGIEDDTAKQFSLPGPNLESALSKCDPLKPTILLYHRPAKFAEAARWGVGLQLAGHTHAGQIPPMDFLVWLIYKYPAGLYKKGDSYIFTSPGTGYWGPPMRLFSRAELTHITLVAE